jgi:hypothetical protein
VLGNLDVGAFTSHAAFKEHLLPSIDKAMKQEPKDAKEKNFKSFLDKTGIDPLEDITSVAFCIKDISGKEPTFVAILGGTFKMDAVVPALMETSDKNMTQTEIAGVKAAVADKDKYIGQAKDGAVVISNDKAVFESALGTSTAAADAKLPLDKALSAIVSEAAIKLATEKGGDNPFKPHLLKIKRVSIVTDLQSATNETRVTMPDNTAAVEFGGFIKTVIAEMAKKPPAGMPPMLADMTKNLDIKYEDADLIILSKMPEETLGELVGMLGKDLEKKLR